MIKNNSSTRQVAKGLVPSWVSVLFTFLAVCLVPWVIYLAYSLPTHHIVQDWDTIWVGLDIGIMVLLLLTGFFAALRSKWIILTLNSVSSFLIVDAWFDIQSARAGFERTESVLMAIFIELPLAVLGYALAFKIIKQLKK